MAITVEGRQSREVRPVKLKAYLCSNGDTPLRLAERYHSSTSENAVFFRAASAAFNAYNLVALVVLCDGSSP